MADTAFKIQYRDETIAGFEQKQSMLRAAVTTEAVINGNQATFLVADSGGAEPVTRGTNGLIPARADNLTQSTATLVEWHDKPRRTQFNIFASQGNGRQIMQNTTVSVMNRKIDSDILTELGNATNTTGAAVTASLELIAKAEAILGLNDVDIEEEDNMFMVASPAMLAYLRQTKEFNNGEYVDVKPLTGPAKKMWRWMGFNWIKSTRIAGKGTASETCFAFHRSAIGHAVNSDGMDVAAGYNDEESYWWARCSMFMGSKLLQNKGVVKILHDGSAYAAS